MGDQVLVGLGKVAATEEASVRGQWGRMRALQHQVPLAIDELPLFLRITAPQEKHHTVPLVIHMLNNAVGELLPPLTLVGACLSLNNRQNAVEQQDTLLRPRLQAAMVRWVYPQIPLDFLEDIDQ